MSGLRNVHRRHRDALSRVRWDRLEALLATHYRDQGYAVDHCGTGAGGRRFDGGIDLKLRKDDQYVLVQCKHWNAKQVPHNDVHQLLGLMVNEGATGAVLVTSGEFTPAARQAAGRLGHVQLVDGKALRAMLGPLPEPEHSLFDAIDVSAPLQRMGARVVEGWGRGLGATVEKEVRRGVRRTAEGIGARLLEMLLLKLAALVVLVLVVWFALQFIRSTIEGLVRPTPQAPSAIAAPTPSRSVAPLSPMAANASPSMGQAPVSCQELIDAPSGTYIDHCATGRRTTPDPAEVRALQRKADEAIEVIRDSTPEM